MMGSVAAEQAGRRDRPSAQGGTPCDALGGAVRLLSGLDCVRDAIGIVA